MLRVDGAGDHLLTLVHRLPQTEPGQDQRYVMQRSLDAETRFLRDIQSGLVELGVAAALVALLAGIVIAGRITSPVRSLVRAAEEMERGN